MAEENPAAATGTHACARASPAPPGPPTLVVEQLRGASYGTSVLVCKVAGTSFAQVNPTDTTVWASGMIDHAGGRLVAKLTAVPSPSVPRTNLHLELKHSSALVNGLILVQPAHRQLQTVSDAHRVVRNPRVAVLAPAGQDGSLAMLYLCTDVSHAATASKVWERFSIIINCSPVSNSTAHLQSVFELPQDVRLVCADEAETVFYIQSSILAADSEYWQDLFSGTWLEGTTSAGPRTTGSVAPPMRTIMIPASAPVVRLYLGWIVTRTVSDTMYRHDIWGLYDLADYYLDAELKAICLARLAVAWESPAKLGAEIWGDFVWTRPEIASCVLKEVVRHRAAVKASPGWHSSLAAVKARIHGSDDIQRIRWDGDMLVTLMEHGF